MITLTTILYEGNFDEILSDESWFINFKSQLITNKIIVVNNLISKDRFLTKLNNLINRNDFEIIYVDEFKDMVIDKYKLNINEITMGYYYTISYFCLLEKVKTKYLLNIASDCMSDIKIDDEFLNDSINELVNNPSCSTTMVAWTKNNYIMGDGKKVGETDSIGTFNKLNIPFNQSEKFNYTFNFTDQFFMGITDNLKKIDFNISENISSKIYQGPAYGGNSFEKRMVGHQIQNNKYNCVYKGSQYYIHDNNYY